MRALSICLRENLTFRELKYWICLSADLFMVTGMSVNDEEGVAVVCCGAVYPLSAL